VTDIIRRRRKELIRWANMPPAGDLILLGQRSSEEMVISCACERGGHAGASPRETSPFIMVPGKKHKQWAEISATRPDEQLTLDKLHNRLRRMYGSSGSTPNPS